MHRTQGHSLNSAYYAQYFIYFNIINNSVILINIIPETDMLSLCHNINRHDVFLIQFIVETATI